MSVQIRNDGTTPTAGENYELTCNISGAGNLNPNTAYRWIKDNGTQTEFMFDSDTFSFTQLRLTDAANYVCEATIKSDYLTNDIVAMSTNGQDVRIESKC